MASAIVGIDVGTVAVRVATVELKGGEDRRAGAVLSGLAEVPIPAGVVRADSIEEPGALRQVVKDALSSAGAKSKKAIVAVGHPSVVVREVAVPAQSMDKVRESLAFHVQESLPMAIDDAQLDFCPTAEQETEQGPMLRGLLVASPKEIVRDLVTAIDGTGVGIASIDHSALALWRATVRGELAFGNVAVVNVGASSTTVLVSQGGAPRLVRVLPQGGNDATKAVASAFKGQNVDAEGLKRQAGMNVQAASAELRPAADAVAQVMGPLIESIRNTLVYFASSNPGAAAERLVLTGGGAYLPGFGQSLSSATRLPVTIGDPFVGLTLAKKMDLSGIRGREAEFATAVGLAMGVA